MPATSRKPRSASDASACLSTVLGASGKTRPSVMYRSQNTTAVLSTQGSTVKVPGSGTILTLGLPPRPSIAKPPSGVNGFSTIALAESKKNGAMVISMPDSSAAR